MAGTLILKSFYSINWDGASIIQTDTSVFVDFFFFSPLKSKLEKHKKVCLQPTLVCLNHCALKGCLMLLQTVKNISTCT